LGKKIGMNSIAKTIKMAREEKRLTHSQVGEFVGLTQHSVMDLELYDDEIYDCITIKQILQLSSIIEVQLSELFVELIGAESDSPENLRNYITVYCRENQMTLDQYEDKVGWTISSFMQNPGHEIMEWNITCLKDQCDLIGRDWKSYLKNMEDAQHAPPAGRGEAPRS